MVTRAFGSAPFPLLSLVPAHLAPAIPHRPTALPVIPTTIPDELKACDQWVVWRYVKKGDRWAKIPFTPGTGQPADTTECGTWTSFDIALTSYRDGDYDGVGFVFSSADHFVGVDLDKCRDPKSDQIEAWASAICDSLGSYTEVSPSGTGVKVFLRGRLPGERHRAGQVEMYDSARFFTVTGHHALPYPATVESRHDELGRLYRRTFEPQPALLTPPPPPPTERDLPRGAMGVTAIIEKAGNARNGDKFRALMDGNWQGAGYGSPSEADLALCEFAYYWGADDNDADALVRQSGLYRDKWERLDYREATLTKARSLAEQSRRDQNGIPSLPAVPATALALVPTDPSVIPFRLITGLGSDRPRPAWLIHDLIAAGSVSGLVGAGGTGKSFVALSMALCVACGIPWHGRATRKGHVIYVVQEGADGFDVRIKAWARASGQPVPATFHRIEEPVRLMQAGNAESLIAAANGLSSQPVFVVLDTFSFVMEGADENVTGEMQKFMSVLRTIRRATGAHVLVVHHTNKQGEMRGNLHFFNELETSIKLIRSQKDRLVLTCDKQRNAAAFDAITLASRVVALDKDESSVVYVPVQGVGAVANGDKSAIERRVLGLLDRPLTHAEWERRAAAEPEPIAKRAFCAAKDRLLTAGDVVTEGEKGTRGTRFRPADRVRSQGEGT